MEQLAQNWTALNARKQITVIVASVAVFAAVYFLARAASQPSLTLLYAGLESGQAGDVVTALEQRAVAYDVRGGSIFVPSNQRDELRMTLASEGLPANSSRGYELLDNLSGFGTTSQMFDAAYWRAKEGELARTILSNPMIRTARVHIANATSNPFQRDLRPTASIAVTTSGGLSPAQARALKFLVASAIAGLDPNDVAVIDGNGGLIASGDDTAPSVLGEDRAQTMREQILRLLEARLGVGNAVVEVAVETVTESEAIRERVVDPESRVAISTDTEERSNSSQDSGSGNVTVASNLPDGDAAGGNSNSQNSETRERVNYEVSETEREIVRAPGAIKRLSVAVLVNGAPVSAEDGTRSVEPLPQEEIDALQELVASAVGFSEARGDMLTIKSMAFTPIGTDGTAAVTSIWSGTSLDIMSMIQMAVAAVVALVLGLMVIRPILSNSASASVPALVGEPKLASDDLEPILEADFAPPLMGEIDNGMGEFSPILPQSVDPSEMDFEPEDPVERLRNLISERKDETVEVLRGWLDESGEKV
ncbi:MAG: flagellar M-ring protein FliF [Marinovum sp.]|nr:flagellar M-ring protein FliF [Marinovum sp.]